MQPANPQCYRQPVALNTDLHAILTIAPSPRRRS